MKIELYISGAAQAAVFAEFLPKWQAAERADFEVSGNALVSATPVPTPVTEAPAPTPEPEPAKKPRGRAAKAAEPVTEAAPAIRATPEDRQPSDVEAVEEAEVVGDVFDDAPETTVLTREDVKLALAAYAEKFGMAKAQAEGPKLMGAPRLSALPDDQEAFVKAIKALREAVANG